MIVKEYGYEYETTLDKDLWECTKGKVTYKKLGDAICLRSGRDALKTIAREYNPTVVYIPALSCDSMSLPFKMYGHRIIYYKLKKDYSIDLEHLEKVMEDGGLFLYMDYFGIKAIIDENLKYLSRKYPHLIFIEDRTHNLIWKNEISFRPHYIMASLRKWLSIPDGGVLWPLRPLKNQFFAEDTSFSAFRLRAQCMRKELL